MALSDPSPVLAPVPLARPAEVAAAGRLSDLLLAAEVDAAGLPALVRLARTAGALRVAVLTAPVGAGAGEAVLLEVASRLEAAGAAVSLLWRGRAPVGERLPGSLVEVPYGGAFADAIPPCDLVVVGCWDLVLPARRLGVAPVALVEQGDLSALGAVPANLSGLIRRALGAAEARWCATEESAALLEERYRVSAEPLPGGTGARRAGPSLLAACEALVASVPVRETDPECTLHVDDLPLAPPARDRLLERLAACPTADLVVPVSQPAAGPFRVVRWRVVGSRAGAPPGETRLWAPLRCEVPVGDARHQAALDLLLAGRPERAFRRLAAACDAGSEADQAVLGRWLVVSLLEAGRAADAAELAGAFARDYPTHPDYLYLAVVAARAAERPIDVVGPTEAVWILGEGSQYDEWFEDPSGLLAEHLERGWPGLWAGSLAGGR